MGSRKLDNAEKLTPTYFRAKAIADRYKREYKDMYLDNGSVGWYGIEVKGYHFYFLFGVNGITKWGRSPAEIGVE